MRRIFARLIRISSCQKIYARASGYYRRIVHAENESNYCAQCQTRGKLLADRALSRLFRSDWPKTLDELDKTRIQSYSQGSEQ